MKKAPQSEKRTSFGVAQTDMRSHSSKAMRYAEFCAGVGGFRLGIEASALKAKLVYTNEINAACEKTYSANFGTGFDSHDLFQINAETLPKFDLMCAGFPCQPFSLAGKELGFEDPRGMVFFKLLEIVKAVLPKIVFLENVTNLVRHDKGRTYKKIIRSLQKAGYSISAKILNSKYFGVPQSRERIYIVCLQKDAFGEKQLEFTEKTTKATPLRKFLESGINSLGVSPKWNEYIDLFTGQKTLAELSFDAPKTRRELERVANGCDLNDCIFQPRSSGIRALSLDEPFPTFTVLNSGGGAHIPILTRERRYLSLNEMKRIMGFPDWYDFTAVSRTDAAKQLANAVCPPVIASICNDLRSQGLS